MRRELTQRAADAPLVLVVEDARALDETSAVLVHQMAGAEEARVLATVRSREPAPDAVTALWKDEFCERVELQPLARREVADLLARVLGGPVEAASVHALWDASRGNVMFLRELVHSGLASGTLAVRDGLWCWTRPLQLAPRLAELLAENLGTLHEPERAVLEVLALGEPLDCETEERDGALRARLAHPLIGEVLNDALPVPTRRRLLRALADEVDVRTAGGRHELLRVVTWRLDAGAEVDLDSLVAAAYGCIHVDAGTAERLAREALRRGAGFGAIDVLAQVNQFTHRPDDTEELLAAAEHSGLSAAEDAQYVVLRANNFTWGLARPDDAVTLLADAAAKTDDDEARRKLEAHIPPMLLFAGRVREAAEHAARIIGDPTSSPVHRMHAYLGLLPSIAAMGRPESALARFPEALELVPQCTEDLPVALGQLASSATLAQQWVGQLDAAEALMRPAFEEGVARGVPLMRGGSALRLGQIALWRGLPRTAAIYLRESLAALHQFDAGFQAWAAHTLRLACALLADFDTADEMAELAERSLAFPLYGSERFRADAWIAAARGQVSDACAIAAEGAEWSLAHDHVVPVVWLSWDRARFGDAEPAAASMTNVAPQVEGILTSLLQTATVALADADAPALDGASTGLEQHGYLLFAAECARTAARLHSSVGLRAREAASDARADALSARCEGASTPLLGRLGTEPPLTRREREIAGLAARGLTDAEIAERLGVSARTVESHLHRAYAKLGVTSRHDLDVVLGA
ncbi:MAG: hypothetical protein E6G60_11305 [Actinobacteria bacterium]|nr:MAG: hypothetical protein E6G60_11305 [Actinomycetota bacterium]